MVRNYLLLFILSTSVLTGFSQNKEITSSSKINHVTVFLNGAQIHRQAKVSLSAGANEVVFEGLTQHLDPNSIQVKAKNKSLTIASVSHKIDYLKDDENVKIIKVLKDSVEDLRFKLAIRKSHETVYREEKSMLIANKSIKGEQNGVDIEDLMDMSDFYRERLQEIETKLLDITRSKRKLNKSIQRIERELNRINGKRGRYQSSILVKVSSKARTSASFDISYITSQAGWAPNYDIRSKDIAGPIGLTYKSDVFQNTGYDWENVKLTLSTGNPTVNNSQPIFSPWYLEYYDTYRNKGRKKAKYAVQAYGGAPTSRGDDLYEVSNEAAIEEDEMEEELYFSTSIADFTTVTESNVNTEFAIDLPYTIKTHEEPSIVEIQKYDLPVEYKYFAAPKMDKDAFLLANIVGWGEYYLLPGNSNVYFDGTFIGESYLNTNTTDDTLAISMGRDKGIVVTREKIKDFSKNTTAGGNKKSTRGYEISVRNNKSKPITIQVMDQVPLSRVKEIEVSILENESAKYEEATGKLLWDLTIQPGETKELIYKFQVKYPKDKSLTNL